MALGPSDVFRKIATEVINASDSAAIDRLVAPGYIDHTGAEDGPDGYRRTLESVREMFSDLHMTVHDLVEEGDRVAARYTVRGVHTGEFMGVPATGKAVSWDGIGIVRVVDGRMVERWNVSDMMGLLEQLRG